IVTIGKIIWRNRANQLPTKILYQEAAYLDKILIHGLIIWQRWMRFFSEWRILMKDNYKRSTGQEGGQEKRGSKEKLSKTSRIKRIVIFTVLIGLVFLVLGSMLFAYYASRAPAFSDEKLRDPVPAQIYDRNDELVTTVYQGQKRELIDIEDVPDHVIDAVLAVEDNRF